MIPYHNTVYMQAGTTLFVQAGSRCILTPENGNGGRRLDVLNGDSGWSAGGLALKS